MPATPGRLQAAMLDGSAGAKSVNDLILKCKFKRVVANNTLQIY